MKTTEYNALKDFQEFVALNSESAVDFTEVQCDGEPVIQVHWQPKSGGEKRGAFIEEVIAVAYAQLKAFNDVFPCRENSLALTNLEQAVLWLAQRKANRQYRGVDGKDEK